MFYYRIRKFPKAIIHLFLFTGQALCGQCREETHRAKMFSQHDIIHISMKAKKLNNKVRIIEGSHFFARAGNDSGVWHRPKSKQRTLNRKFGTHSLTVTPTFVTAMSEPRREADHVLQQEQLHALHEVLLRGVPRDAAPLRRHRHRLRAAEEEPRPRNLGEYRLF